MDDVDEQRLARNEALFRSVNEGIAAASGPVMRTHRSPIAASAPASAATSRSS